MLYKREYNSIQSNSLHSSTRHTCLTYNMNINIRRTVAGLFIVIFLIVTPILLLYTAGYRYNLKKQRLSVYGSLVIESQPSNALVEIQGLDKTYTTPARINHLDANNYQIKVSKDGYTAWQKTLPVITQQTTFAEDIVLFKLASPEKIANLQISSPEPLPNNDGLTYINPRLSSLHFYNTTTEKDTLLLAFNKNTTIGSRLWSKDNNYLLVTTKTGNKTNHLIINKNFPEKPLELSSDFEQISWSENYDNILFARDERNITQVEINTDQLKLKQYYSFPEAIDDFRIHHNEIYFLETKNNRSFIKKIDPQDSEKLQPKIELPDARYTIKKIHDKTIVLHRPTKNEYTFVNDTLDTLLYQQKNLENYAFHDNSPSLLLLYDRSEIRIIDLKNASPVADTIYRVSDGISQVVWDHEPNYLIFTENQHLRIIELDPREKRLVIDLPGVDIQSIQLTTNGKNIFYTNSQGMLNKLPIMD